MTRRHAWLAALLLVGLAGCVTSPKNTVPGDSLSGRLSVKVDAIGTEPARSVSAAFDLQGNPDEGQMNLSSPLGTVLAQAKWSAGQAVLSTSEGDRLFASLDALTLELLGESLPVAALFDWLRGRPWSGAPSEVNDAGLPGGFQQMGWVVDTSRFPQEGWVTARRAQPPAVTVRARVDTPPP